MHLAAPLSAAFIFSHLTASCMVSFLSSLLEVATLVDGVSLASFLLLALVYFERVDLARRLIVISVGICGIAARLSPPGNVRELTVEISILSSLLLNLFGSSSSRESTTLGEQIARLPFAASTFAPLFSTFVTEHFPSVTLKSCSFLEALTFSWANFISVESLDSCSLSTEPIGSKVLLAFTPSFGCCFSTSITPRSRFTQDGVVILPTKATSSLSVSEISRISSISPFGPSPAAPVSSCSRICFSM
mmetsp:Transcript_34145/g.69741  ORF Transcript_34145/g.69741 Transcript_34145/m.69741 type:complete len:247 (+) Transcript_34145:3091-3831(+)